MVKGPKFDPLSIVVNCRPIYVKKTMNVCIDFHFDFIIFVWGPNLGYYSIFVYEVYYKNGSFPKW